MSMMPPPPQMGGSLQRQQAPVSGRSPADLLPSLVGASPQTEKPAGNTVALMDAAATAEAAIGKIASLRPDLDQQLGLKEFAVNLRTTIAASLPRVDMTSASPSAPSAQNY